MYNLIECSKNYRNTTGSLWNYCRDEPNNGAVGSINYFIINSKSLNYKKVLDRIKDVKIVVP